MTALAAMVDDLTRRGEVSAEEVRQLRGLVFGLDDITVTPAEAEALIALDEAVVEPGPEWRAFFVEALTDFVVRQQQPSGYIDEAKAKWLLDHVARDGTVKTAPPLPGFKAALERRFASGRGAVMMHHAIAGWAEWPQWSDRLGGRRAPGGMRTSR